MSEYFDDGAVKNMERWHSFAAADTEFPKPETRPWKTSAAVALSGAIAGAALLIGINGDAERSGVGETSQDVEPASDADDASAPPTSSVLPAEPLTPKAPEFNIDFHEVSQAQAAMVDVGLEQMNDAGHLESIKSGGGGLFIKSNQLYFATAATILESSEQAEDVDQFARVIVPAGAGYDPLEYVIPRNEFEVAEENPGVLEAPVQDYGGLLTTAIKEGRVTPIIATTYHKNVGKTVVGSALEESPLLDENGFVLTRTLRHSHEDRREAYFSTDEPFCTQDIEVGDFVLNAASEGRLYGESYGVVTEVRTLDDPHHENACITNGAIALNFYNEVHTA